MDFVNPAHLLILKIVFWFFSFAFKLFFDEF